MVEAWLLPFLALMACQLFRRAPLVAIHLAPLLHRSTELSSAGKGFLNGCLYCFCSLFEF
jgi:hypothetical protein